jgi:hypothetical protein
MVKKMEQMETWKGFLNKSVKLIIEDKPSPYPKLKIGILEAVADTHIILKTDKRTEAIRLNDIRRIELNES